MEVVKRILGFTSAQRREETKYQQVDTIIYEGRVLPDLRILALDVRNFFVNPLAHELQALVKPIISDCDDQKAAYIDAWVQSCIRYTSDKARWDLPEFWLFPFETLTVRQGDCEDGAILAANLLLAAGVPAWKLRLSAGEVQSGEGHCWLTYYCEKTDRWVALDWCYHPTDKPIAERPDYKDTGLIKRVWFSWTAEKAFFGEAAGWSAGGGKSGYTTKAGLIMVLIPARES